MRKKILIFLLSLLIVSGFCIDDARETFGAGKIIYTAATKSSSDNSGNGTISNPYNLFETALSNASNGDTIYILDAGGFLNASDNSPLIINKNITIKGNNSVFNVRASGIVLAADVTFENIALSFGSRYHDAIFANGHNLTLKNVSCENGTRKVDIFGGGLYIGGSNVASSGTQSVITIDGGGNNLGNIYAGSLNGDFVGNISINLSNMTSSRNTNVYISGANEPYVNLDDLFSLEEPAAPTVNSGHTISGAVNITIKDCNIPTVSQVESSSAGSSTLTMDTNGKYWSSISVNKVDTIKVKGGGTFAPTMLNDIGNVTLSNGGLDLSNLTNTTLKSLLSDGASGNRLILGKEQYLTITDSVTGNFIFETENGYNGHSGPALYDFAYIRLSNTSNATFSYNCIPGMEMTFDKVNSYIAIDTGVEYGTVWKTSEASEYSPFAIKGLEITNPNITVKVSEFSNSISYNANVSVSEELSQQDCYFDLVPIQYKVKYMGREYIGVVQYDGYSYYSEIPELKMSFMAMSDYDLSEAKICVYTFLDGSGNAPQQPDCGVYTISILPFSEGEQIVKSVKLIITDENGNYPSEPSSEPPSEPSSEPSSESPSESPSKPSNEPPSESPSDSTSESSSGQSSKPSSKPSNKPSNESATKPSKESNEKPTQRPIQKPTDDSIIHTTEHIKETEDDKADETSNVTEGVLDDVLETETEQQSTENYTENITESLEDASKDTLEEVSKDETKDDESNGLPKIVIGVIIASGVLLTVFVGIVVVKRFKDIKRVK